MPATTGQVAPAQEAGRPQPQTTVEGAGGPFIRHSQPGRRAQYANTNNAFGALVTQPLVATPGYIRGLRVRIAGTGGAGTTTVTAAADAPWNVGALITVKDAFGTPLIVGDGFSVLKLIPKYGGQFGLHACSDPANLPSFSAVATGVSSSGNFTLTSYLPFEFSKAYGVISGANASLLPTLQWQLGSSASFFGVAPNTTLPVIEVDVDADFYWLPEGVNVEPPGLGSTCQWILQQANPTIGSASTTRVSLPRLGGYITTLIFILRDATGARIDPFTASNRFRILIDGVPILDTRWDEFLDDMQIQFAGAGTGQWARDTGVWAWTRKTSLSQESGGLFDTGETWLSTNPGTLIEIEGAPWATIGSPPATLSVLVGQVVPAGSIIQGLPEL
jgi:hypothetical protein